MIEEIIKIKIVKIKESHETQEKHIIKVAFPGIL